MWATAPAERGLLGVTRRRRRQGCTRTHITDPRPDDLVHRQFRLNGPDRLWVQDVTQHRTCGCWSTGRSTPGLVVSWDGRSRITCVPNSSLTRSTWPPGAADHRRVRSPTATTGRTTAPGCSDNDCVEPGCSARWALSAMPSTTPLQRASSHRCNANSSTGTPGPPRRARPSDVPLNRRLLQPDPSSLHPRVPPPHRLRSHRSGMIPQPARPESGGHSNVSPVRGDMQVRVPEC